MKTDVNGCSTCPNGGEQYESYTSRVLGKNIKRVQYDYRTPEGKLFACVAKSLVEARARRDKWLKEQAE